MTLASRSDGSISNTFANWLYMICVGRSFENGLGAASRRLGLGNEA